MKVLLNLISIGLLGLLILGCWSGSLSVQRTIIPSVPQVKLGRNLKDGESNRWSILGRGTSSQDWTFSGFYLLRSKQSGIWISGEILDKAPNHLMQTLRIWDGETVHLPFRQFRGREVDPDFYPFGKGLWMVGSSQPGMADPITVYPRGEKVPPKVETVHLDFTHGPENTCGIREMWKLKGPIREPLYLPLKELLADCVLVSDPDHPNIKPELNVPVIVGQDSHGKDIVVRRPLITKFVKSDGDPIQVFTGNRKEDKYFDRKYNPSQSTKP